MQTCKIPQTDLEISRVGLGSASLASWDRSAIRKEDVTKAGKLIDTACSQGITLFDHADVYAFGKAEAVFGEALKSRSGLRKQITIQSKCGQILPEGWQPGSPVRVNLSREHIVLSVEGSLKRLGTDYLDILLLHAADTLVEPEEVAHAFDDLHRSGKVRHFGLSNYTISQIALLIKTISRPLSVNQIQLGLANPGALAGGMDFGLQLVTGWKYKETSLDSSGISVVDYCRQIGMQVQAWSPIRGVLKSSTEGSPKAQAVTALLSDLAKKKGTSPAVIALSWLLRHPAPIIPILGGDNPNRLIENCTCAEITLSHEEWYDLLAAAA